MNAKLIRPRSTRHGLVAILALSALISTGFGATLVVTNLASLGPGTLRQALSDNIALGGGNTIVFSNVAGTITLQGELSVNAPVTIRGPGTNILAISGNNLSRIFTVTAGPTLISDLTIRNGRAIGTEGQGMQEDGQDGQGGGIWNLNSALMISNCVVLSNSVVGGVGAERKNGVVGRGGKGLGGGVYNSGGTLLILNCSLEGNQAAGGRGGFAQSNAAGPGGDGQGGAIYTSVGTGQVAVCSFANNMAAGGMGGGIGGGSQPGAGGQGYGGGLYSVGPLTIHNSTLRGSTAIGGSAGDGTDNGIGNGYGGGIYSISTLTLISSTIVSNNASGGGLNPSSGVNFGGGIFSGSDTGITNCTVVYNRAGLGGGVYGTVSAANSIFAGNTATNGPDINGTINSQDYNLIQNTNSASLLGFTTHCVTGQDPLLGPLQDNGGPTLTMALLSGSPALDQGKSFGLTTDQRGMVRPSNIPSITDAAGGDGSDIGAFELLPLPREFGVDVSHFQGESGVSPSSWSAMFASGKRFVFIKATEGLSVLDAAMENNVNRATAAGLRAGVYHYAHPELRPTTNGAIQEADYLLAYAGNFVGPGYLRPVIDLEFNAAAVSTTELTDWVIAFANEIVTHRGAGAAPIIYCNQSFANNEFDTRLANYDLWLRTITGLDPALNDPPGAGFVDPTGVFNNWSFWQYNDAGSSGGISPLDLNICHSEFKPLDSFLIPAVINPVLPTIDTQPQSRTVSLGNNATFNVSVSVSSSTPLSYQWRFHGTNLSEATAKAFTRNNAQLTDAGPYTVVITNAGGSVTSTIATLTVTNPPPAAPALVLYEENFDGYAGPSIVSSPGTTNGFKIFFGATSGSYDFTAKFGFDYSTVTSPTNIPSAPHASGGSTKGLYLTVNKDATSAAAAVNLYPLNQTFTGNFALKFDLWINYPNTLTATEHALFGVNHSANVTNRVGQITSDGLFFAMSSDGAVSSGSTTLRDFAVFRGSNGVIPILLTPANTIFGPEPLLGLNFDNADAGFAGLFPPMAVTGFTTPAGAAGNRWVSVEVRHELNLITWLLNNTTVAQYTNTSAFTNGSILLGYNDNFPSPGGVDNFVIFDNLRVEAPGPAPIQLTGLAVSLAGALQFSFTNTPGASFTVLATTNASLPLGNWTSLGAVTEISPGQFQFSDSQAKNTQRYYRVRWP